MDEKIFLMFFSMFQSPKGPKGWQDYIPHTEQKAVSSASPPRWRGVGRGWGGQVVERSGTPAKEMIWNANPEGVARLQAGGGAKRNPC